MIVENGTGIADANSYASTSYADTYFQDRGVTGWSGTTLAKEQWLIQATDYLETKMYNGKRIFPETQALSFPRDCFWVDGMTISGLPDAIQRATCEVALAIKDGRFSGGGTCNSNPTGLVKRIHSKTGSSTAGIEKEIEYIDDIQYYRGKVFLPVVDALLRPYLSSTSGRTYR